MSQSLISLAFPGNIGGDDIDPGCLVLAKFPKKDGGGSAAAVALEPIQPLDEGENAPVEQFPENRGPAIKPATFEDVRGGLPGHLQKFVDDMCHVDPVPSDSVLRRQAMKARRLDRILGDGWSVKFCPGTYNCNDDEDLDTQKAMMESTKGHLFFISPDWFWDTETWGDDRTELGPMEDQVAEQLEAFAKRFTDAAKKLRDASAQAEFIKSQKDRKPTGERWLASDVINIPAEQPKSGPASRGVPVADNYFAKAAEEYMAASDIQPATKAKPTIDALLESKSARRFFDSCLVQGMDVLLKSDNLAPHLVADSDYMSVGNVRKIQEAAEAVSKQLERIAASALLLTVQRRDVLRDTHAANYEEVIQSGCFWPHEYEAEPKDQVQPTQGADQQ